MDKETKVMQLLENILYARFHNLGLEFTGDGNYYSNLPTKLVINTPEGFKLELSGVYVNIDRTAPPTKTNPLIFNFKESQNYLIRYGGQAPQEVSKITFINSNQYYGHLESIISDTTRVYSGTGTLVIIHNPSSSENRDDLNEFMSQEYTDWLTKLNMAIDAAINGNFTNIVKYKPKIVSYELRNDPDNLKRIGLIKKISESSIDDNRFKLLIGLLDVNDLTPSNADNVLNSFFITDVNGNMPFEELINELDDSDEFLLIIKLIEVFYKKYKNNPDDLRNQIENLVETQIVPIFHSTYPDRGYLKARGVNIKSEFTATGILIEELETYNGSTSPGDPTGTIEYLANQHYSYQEIIGVMPTSSKINAGLLYSSIYPIPAFALRTFDETFSDDYTTSELLKDAFNFAGVILPFFKLVRGINVLRNLLALGVVVTDVSLGAYIERKLLESDEGTKLLHTYSAIMLTYNTLNLAKSYLKFGQIVIRNYEDLETIWDVYASAVDYSDLLEKKEFQEMFIQIQLNRVLLPVIERLNQLDEE